MNTGLTNDEFCRLINNGRRSYRVNVIVTVYDHPQGFPNGYVARAHIVAQNRYGAMGCGKSAYASPTIYIARETLDEVRAAIPDDMVKMIRHPQDDPVIIETYV